MISAQLFTLLEALSHCMEHDPVASVELPLVTVSLANEHAHWRKRQARSKAHREAAGTIILGALRRERVTLDYSRGVVVRLVRVAPRLLDSDNLAGALKAVRDGVADAFGLDDRDERVCWVPDQEKGPAAVRIEVYAR